MACDTEQVEAIEACRTCGIYYMSNTNYLKPIFQSPVDYPEMMLIRLELAQWKVEISENDGLPQHVCSSCIHEFQKVFRFRSSCVDTQEQLRIFYNLREENLANLKIKTEIMEPQEEASQCDFIYVDDLSDEEYDSVTPFKIPHVPIKEEKIEEATVPLEDDQSKTGYLSESASAGAVTNRVLASLCEMAQSPVLEEEQQHNASVTKSSPTSNALVLETHLRPPAQASVECELCQHLSPSPEEHKQHMRRVHQNRDMECHICGKVFKNSTQARFKFHLKWHNINKHVKCSQCGFVCSSRQGLREHKRAVHAKINCKICGVGVLAKKMKSHLRDHAILTQYRCEYCSEGFSTGQDRENHIWQIHANENTNDISNDSSSFEEEINSKNISNNEECANNLYEDVVSIELICAHCNQKFVHQSDLELHVKQEHFNTAQQLVASQNIPPTNSSTIHQGVASSIVPMCNYQDKEDSNESLTGTPITVFEDYGNDDESMELPQESQLVTPQMQVANNTQQQLPQFNSNIHLTNSQYNDDDDEVTVHHNIQSQSHSTDTSHEINYSTESEAEVEETFSYIPNDIPQFACAKCSNTFTTIDQLRLHYQQHQLDQHVEKSTTKSKFNCQICDKQFDLKFSLNRHMRRHNTTNATE